MAYKQSQFDDEGDREGPTTSTIRTISFVFGFIAFISFIFCLAAPYWRTTSTWGSALIISNIWAFEGIFLTCVQNSGVQGNNECYQMPTFAGYGAGSYGTVGSSTGFMPGGVYSYLNAFRALMIIGFIASLGGVVCSVLGMRCASVVDEESKTKRWIVIVGGICHLCAGLLTGVCVSWYAALVVWEYYSPYYQTQKLKYTLGACLYVGWVAMLFALVAGCLMTCCACCNKPADSSNTYAYKPAKAQKENFSYPPEPAIYRSDPIVEKSRYERKPDYHRTSSKSRRSNRRDDVSSGSSRSSSPTTRHSRSHNSKRSRGASDSIHASGFV